jgi:hypothetical protein
MIDGCTVKVRWRTNVPGSGYDLWDGDRWVPISPLEYRAYTKERGLVIWTNPPGSGRG